MKKILDCIIHKLKENALKRRKSMSNRVVEYKPLGEIRNVLFFWTAGEEEETWQKQLVAHWKNVKVDKLCFVPVGIEVPEKEGTIVLKKDDLSFGGNVRNGRLHGILEKKYDLLVNLTSEGNALVDYVLMNTHAHCIVGRKREGAVADITIADEGNDKGQFITKLIRILSDINKY